MEPWPPGPNSTIVEGGSMSIAATIFSILSPSISSLLLKRWLGEDLAGVAGNALDFAGKQLLDTVQQRKALRSAEAVADDVARQLVPILESVSGVNVEAVSYELATTLTEFGSVQLFLANNLGAPRIAEKLRATRPLPLTQLSADEVALYNRALDEAVRYLVATAHRLPEFQTAAAAESLRRLENLATTMESIVGPINKIRSDLSSVKPSESFADFEKDYRQSVIKAHDYLLLYGADLRDTSVRQKLSLGYTTLSLQVGSEDNERTVPISQALDNLTQDSQRVMIRADAGSGKSTVFRWLAMTAAGYGALTSEVAGSEASGKDDVRWFERVPFLLRLRDLTYGILPQLEAWGKPEIDAGFLESAPAGWVRATVEDGRALLLLDGIDEIPKWSRPGFRQALATLLERFPNLSCVVSTRPQAVDEEWLRELGFREATIAPLAEASRDEFIDRWHIAACESTAPDDLVAAQETASRLKLQLSDNPDIGRLTTNPLLAAMICALHRDRSKILPKRQHEVVDTLCQILLERDRQTGLDLSRLPKPYAALTYDQKRDMAMDFAEAMVRSGQATVERSAALIMIATRLARIPDRRDGEAEAVLDAIVERSGIINWAGDALLEFNHNTFRDYLAACRLVATQDIIFLSTLIESSGFESVLLFAAAVPASEGMATTLVRSVLSNPQRPNEADDDSTTHARRLVAVRMRGVAQYLDPDLTNELNDMVREMFPPKGFTEAEALAGLGNAVLPFLDNAHQANARQAAATVRLLALMGTKEARSRLSQFLHDSRMTVLSELARAVDPLEIPAILRSLEQVVNDAIRPHIRSLERVRGRPDIRGIDIAQTSVTDLTPLQGLLGLRRLVISFTPIATLSPIAGLRSLEILACQGCPISDIAPLAGMTALVSLGLSTTGIRDLSPLLGLDRLRLLTIARAQTNDLSPLASLAELTQLDISHTNAEEASFLLKLDKLQRLIATRALKDLDCVK